MKTLCAMLSAALPAVLLAVSTGMTAKDYVFTRPAIPSNIVGQVTGDAGDYGARRSEDFAWLFEAAAERRLTMTSEPAYVERSGTWPLSVTNELADSYERYFYITGATTNGQTNVVWYIGFTGGTQPEHADHATVAPRSFNGTIDMRTGGVTFLDPDAELSDDIRAAVDGSKYTNVVSGTRRVLVATNHQEIITTEWTGGTDVYTNTIPFVATNDVPFTETNIVEIGYHDLISKSTCPYYTNTLVGAIEDSVDPGIGSSMLIVTNMFAHIRNAHRCIRTALVTNRVSGTTRYYQDNDGDTYDSGPLHYEGDPHYSCSISRNEYDDGYYIVTKGEVYTSAGTVHAQSDINHDLCMTGGINRVRSAKAWLCCTLTSYESVDGPDGYQVYNDYTIANVAIPCGSATVLQGPGTGGCVVFSFSAPDMNDAARTASDLVQARFYDYSSDAPNVGSGGGSLHLSLLCDYVILVCELNPRTVLPGW